MNVARPIRLTEFSHGGGCGCKIAPAVPSELLAATPLGGLPKELLVGTETADDAAVYRLNDTQAPVGRANLPSDFRFSARGHPVRGARKFLIDAATRSPGDWNRHRIRVYHYEN
jgi:hypothetical protein